jgi:hypothetical protein
MQTFKEIGDMKELATCLGNTDSTVVTVALSEGKGRGRGGAHRNCRIPIESKLSHYPAQKRGQGPYLSAN